MHVGTMKQCGVFVCFVMCIMQLNAEFDVDYYFGAPSAGLRSQSEECGEPLYEYLCYVNCPRDHVCFMRKCLCVDMQVDGGQSRGRKQKSVYKRSEYLNYQNPPGFIDLTKMSAKRPHDDYSEKPVLRHHIAHFCPNLDEARACIRKCMPKGKPAFCGKDHVCYCGHNYHDNVKDDNVDAETTYAQFKDLYEKYFGKNYQQHFEESYERK